MIINRTRMTPIRSIRLKCLDCSAGQIKEVRECVILGCALYPFRMGRNPNRAGTRNAGAFQKKDGTAKDFPTVLNGEG
jgi:hypothetical protein